MTLSLSDHFATVEVFGDHKPTAPERFLAEQLARRCLEPLRRHFGCPLHITDGYRTWERFKELKSAKYNPYKFSDHSFLLEWHPYGVGAVDIVKVEGTRGGHSRRVAFTEDEYNAAVALLPPDCYGQLIWYRKRGHMHISNPRSIWFSELALSHLQLPKQVSTYIKE